MLKLYHKNWYICMMFLAIQQVIVASSTYWIANLAEAVKVGENFTFYLIAFMLSLVLVYLPGILSVRELEKAIYVAYRCYVEKFDTSFYNQTHIAKDKLSKDRILPFVSSESYLVIQGYLSFIYGSVSLALNISFNLLVLIYLIPAKILLSYLVGFILASLLLLLTYKQLAEKGRRAQDFRAKLQRTVSLIWDNILWGNRYNWQRYQVEKNNYFEQAKTAAVSQLSFSSIVSAAGMLFMLVPVLGSIGWLFIAHSYSSTILIVLVATLPRQIQILQFSYELISMLSNWATSKSQVTSLSSILEVQSEADSLKQHIKFNEINIEGDVGPIDLQSLILPSNGRITIRGGNGVGKSCLLAWLKHKLGDNAFYLPAVHELNFSTNTENMSTGEMIRANFFEIKSQAIENIDVLLIDEWDANLDDENITKLSAIIDKLASEILVVEVRHRYSEIV